MKGSRIKMDKAFRIENATRTPAGVSVVLSPLVDGDEELTLLLAEEFWKPLGYAAGTELSEDAVDELKGLEELSRAVSRTLKILSGADHSRVQLIRKLKMHGFEGEPAERAADYAETHGYIDENRQAAHAAEYFVRHKYWGRKRIAAELLMRGYRKSAVVHAAEMIDDDTYMASLHVMMDRKYRLASSREEREHLFASLFRLGYSLSEIKLAEKDLAEKDLENEE